MKNLIVLICLLFSSFMYSQLLYDQMIMKDILYEVDTVVYNCGYEIEGDYISVFTFSSKQGNTEMKLSLTGYATDTDKSGYKYVYCYDRAGVDHILTFNSNYSYCSVTRTEDQVTIVEFILTSNFKSKPKTNKI